MDHETFRRLHLRYSVPGSLAAHAYLTEEYSAYVEHMAACGSCDDWVQGQAVVARGARVDDFPCVHIAYRVTARLESDLDDPFDDPNVVIWAFVNGTYGVPVRDGGASMIAIFYCPWCGVKLPAPSGPS